MAPKNWISYVDGPLLYENEWVFMNTISFLPEAFSLFSVVSFPNKECQTTKLTNPATSGLCLSAEECAATGGTPEGNCASSFGVCCFRR